MNTPILVVASCAELIGLALVIHLWRQRASVVLKLLWTLVLLIPLLGPLLYGGLFEVPSPQPGHERAQETASATTFSAFSDGSGGD